MAHSSSGLGHRPLKAEITGSNPVCATTASLTPFSKAKLGPGTADKSAFANILLTKLFDDLFFRRGAEQFVKAKRSRLLKPRAHVAIGIEGYLYTGVA